MQITKPFTLLVLCLFLNLGTFAQSVSAPDSTDQSKSCLFKKSYVKSYFDDSGALLLSPFHWNTKQWLGMGLSASIFVGLMTQDVVIHDFFQRNRSGFTDNVSKYVGEPWGSGVYSMGVMGGLYLYGAFGRNEKAKKTAMLGVKVFVVSGVVNYIFKELFQRHRPYEVETEIRDGTSRQFTQYEWDGPFSHKLSIQNNILSPFTSFPSGHTVSAFATATLLATVYKEYKWVPVVSYTLATITGLSRINDNKHWASDVFIGAVLGYGVAKLIYNKNTWGITVAPYANSNTLGMVFAIPVQQHRKDVINF